MADYLPANLLDDSDAPLPSNIGRKMAADMPMTSSQCHIEDDDDQEEIERSTSNIGAPAAQLRFYHHGPPPPPQHRVVNNGSGNLGSPTMPTYPKTVPHPVFAASSSTTTSVVGGVTVTVGGKSPSGFSSSALEWKGRDATTTTTTMATRPSPGAHREATSFTVSVGGVPSTVIPPRGLPPRPPPPSSNGRSYFAASYGTGAPQQQYMIASSAAYANPISSVTDVDWAMSHVAYPLNAHGNFTNRSAQILKSTKMAEREALDESPIDLSINPHDLRIPLLEGGTYIYGSPLQAEYVGNCVPFIEWPPYHELVSEVQCILDQWLGQPVRWLKIIVGQIPYNFDTTLLTWLCYKVCGAVVKDCELIRKHGVAQGCAFANVHEGHVDLLLEHVHKKVFADDGGFWLARTPQEWYLLNEHTEMLSQDKSRYRWMPCRPYRTISVELPRNPQHLRTTVSGPMGDMVTYFGP